LRLRGNRLELFRALPGDLAPRDAQDLMAYPFFSLAKSKRIVPIDFRPSD
jgi:plasmid replication initiation protein